MTGLWYVHGVSVSASLCGSSWIRFATACLALLTYALQVQHSKVSIRGPFHKQQDHLPDSICIDCWWRHSCSRWEQRVGEIWYQVWLHQLCSCLCYRSSLGKKGKLLSGYPILLRPTVSWEESFDADTLIRNPLVLVPLALVLLFPEQYLLRCLLLKQQLAWVGVLLLAKLEDFLALLSVSLEVIWSNSWKKRQHQYDFATRCFRFSSIDTCDKELCLVLCNPH